MGAFEENSGTIIAVGRSIVYITIVTRGNSGVNLGGVKELRWGGGGRGGGRGGMVSHV